MSKPIIAVDIDDVLTASNEGVRLYVNRTFGTAHTEDDYLVASPYKGYWDRVWNLGEKKNKERYHKYLVSGETARLLPIKNAIRSIKKLQERYGLVIVTARNIEQIEHTEKWLQKHAPGVFKKVDFLALHPKGREATKAMILQEMGAKYLIDDSVEHCHAAAEAGIQALLFGEYGWNRDVAIPGDIIRVKDWAEVLRYFNEEH